jgi:hypothetical protein
MDNGLNAKEMAFRRVVQWLTDYGFRIEEETRNKGRRVEIQFEAKVYPEEEGRFFVVTFSNELRESFLIRSTVFLEKEYSQAIDGLRKKEQQQLFIEIFRLVYTQHIDCDIKFPDVYLYKQIFIEALTDKQFFFDSVFNLLRAMRLVEGRYDELYYSFFPDVK